MTEVLWQFKNCQVGQPQPRLQVEDWQIHTGITAVLGASGAGKTTLLNVLVGYEHVDAGLVEAQADAKRPAWIPVSGGLWSGVTVTEHLRLCGLDKPAAAALLQTVQLQHRADAVPDTLSAGECDRLALACAWATRRPVVVADEPLAHVDESQADELWDHLLADIRAREASFIFATHQAHRVLASADHVACLRDGQLCWHGSVETAYRHPPSAEVARFFGPVNWLSADSDLQWLGTAPAHACVRPEQLEVCADDAGPLLVKQSNFDGRFHRTLLQGDAGERRFWHQGTACHVGQRVRLALLALCMLVLCACDSNDGPLMDLTVLHTRSVPAVGPRLPAPRGVAPSQAGGIWVLDNAGRVVHCQADGSFDKQWWMPSYNVGRPEGILERPDGRVVVADTHYNRVVTFSAEGEVEQIFGSQGREQGQFLYPIAICSDPSGHLYVAEYGGNDRIQKFTAAGEFILEFGQFGTDPGQFQRPGGLVWHAGTLYIADAFNNRVQIFDESGVFKGILGDGRITWAYPYDITVGPQGDLWVVEYTTARVTRVGLDGQVKGRYGQPGRDRKSFATPWGLCVLPSGDIVVADTGNHRMVILRP